MVMSSPNRRVDSGTFTRRQDRCWPQMLQERRSPGEHFEQYGFPSILVFTVRAAPHCVQGLV